MIHKGLQGQQNHATLLAVNAMKKYNIIFVLILITVQVMQPWDLLN